MICSKLRNITLISTNEYEKRFQPIISAWEAPSMPSYGEQVILMDASKRYVQKNGVMCVAITTAEGKDIMDLSFQHETQLIDEVSRIERW